MLEDNFYICRCRDKINSLNENEITNFSVRYGDQKIIFSLTKNRFEQLKNLSHQLLDSFKESGNFNDEYLFHLLEGRISDSDLSSEDGMISFIISILAIDNLGRLLPTYGFHRFRCRALYPVCQCRLKIETLSDEKIVIIGLFNSLAGGVKMNRFDFEDFRERARTFIQRKRSTTLTPLQFLSLLWPDFDKEMSIPDRDKGVRILFDFIMLCQEMKFNEKDMPFIGFHLDSCSIVLDNYNLDSLYLSN